MLLGIKVGAFRNGYVIFALAGVTKIALDSHGIPPGLPMLRGLYTSCVRDAYL